MGLLTSALGADEFYFVSLAFLTSSVRVLMGLESVSLPLNLSSELCGPALGAAAGLLLAYSGAASATGPLFDLSL